MCNVKQEVWTWFRVKRSCFEWVIVGQVGLCDCIVYWPLNKPRARRAVFLDNLVFWMVFRAYVAQPFAWCATASRFLVCMRINWSKYRLYCWIHKQVKYFFVLTYVLRLRSEAVM